MKKLSKNTPLGVILFAGGLPVVVVFVALFVFGSTPHVNQNLHELIELLGSCIAIGVALLLTLRIKHEEGPPHLLAVAVALAVMGFLDGVHAEYGIDIRHWYRHVSTFEGGMLFALVWPLSHVLIRRARLFAFTALCLGFSALLLFWAWAEQPDTWDSRGYYTLPVKALNILGGLGFLAASSFFLVRCRRTLLREDLAFACQTMLFGIAALLFGVSHTWAVDWWIWHGFRFLAYSIVLFAVYEKLGTDISERKQAEAALSAERRKFNTILDSVPPYVCLLTPDYHVNFANCEFRTRFGEHLGRKCYEFLFNRTEPCEVCETYKVLTDGKPRNWQWTGPDGCHYDIFDFPFTDTDGSKLILEMGIDMTEREKARTALESERKRFESVLDGLPAMICLLTPNYDVAFANKTFRKVFGESQGRKCYDYCFGKTAPCEFCESFKVLQDGKPHEWEVIKDGQYIHAFDMPFSDVDGSPLILEMDLDVTKQREAEEKLRRSEAELKEAQRVARLGNWGYDAATRHITWSDEIYRILGRAPSDEISLDQQPSLFTPDTWNRLAPAMENTLRTGEPCELELETVLPDGQHGWVLARGERMHNNGNVTGLSGIALDITERKQAELARRDSEQNFSTLADFVPQFVWMCGPDGLNFYFNQRWFEYTGLSKEQSYGRGWNTPFHPDDKQAAWNAWNNATGTGETYQVESRLRAADGSYRWFLMRGSPMRDESGKIVRWFGTCTDIHDMKLAGEALQVSEARYRRLIDQNAAGVIRIGANETILDCNDAAAHMLGYESGEDLRGSPMANHHSDLSHRELLRKQLAESKVLLSQEVCLKKKDGSPMWTLVNLSIIDSPGVSEHEILATFTDVTEIRKAHEEIRALNETLERRVRERTAELQAVFDTVPIGLAIANDPQGQHIHGNPAIEQMLNASGDAELSRRSADCAPYRVFKDGHELPPEDLPMQRAARGETVAAELLEIARVDGKTIAVHSVAAPLFDERHQPRGAVGAFLDITDRRQMEQALRASEAELRVLTENLQTAVALFDEQGAARICNKAFRRIFGFPEGAGILNINTRDWVQWQVFDERGVLLNVDEHPARKAVLTLTPVRNQIVAMKQPTTSGLIWLLINAEPLVDAQGKLHRLICTFHDITERKRAEEALREATQRFQTIVDHAPIAIYVKNPDGRFVFGNRQMEHYTGISLERLMGMTDYDFASKEDADRWRENDLKVLGGQRAEFEETGTDRAGRPYVNISVKFPLCDQSGKPVEICGISTDITAIKRIEQALRESEQSVRRKLDSILLPEGDLGNLELAEILDIPVIHKLLEEFYAIVHVTTGLIDIHGKVLAVPAWQPACMKFHRAHPESCKNCVESDVQLSAGVPAGEFKLYKCKNNLWDAATPITIGDQHLGNLYFGQFFFTDEVVDFEFFREQAKRYGFDEQQYLKAIEAVPRISREVFQASMTFLTRFAKVISQLSYSTIKLARSMTETKTVNEQLSTANQELESFTYAVAHDLRAPLRHIHGFSSLLAEESTELSDSGRQHLKFITDGVERMSQLLEDLLNLSRTSRQPLRLQLCGIKPLISQVMAEMGPDLAGRKVDWKIGELPFVKCDPALTKYVLINLISNALKFTRECERAVIEIGSTQKDGESVIFVRDNGVGFDMKYAGKLFGVFQRLHRQEDFEGTGVGLALVQRIVRKHGGRVWAEAELNKGATFYFTLGEMTECAAEVDEHLEQAV